MADADLLIEEVSAYLKQQDVEYVREAIAFSHAAHQGQTRQSGDPYVSHPLAVARILTTLHLDVQAIIAALLHDVVEDTEVTTERVAGKFGKPVAELVDGLSKLDPIHFQNPLHDALPISEAVDIQHLGEGQRLALHLFVDAVDIFFPAGKKYLQIGRAHV